MENKPKMSEIETFDPTSAELMSLVELTKDISAEDLEDPVQMEMVSTARKQLKQARVDITKKGKEMREGALAFQKAVIAKEKELIAIISPEEDRLKSIEQEAKDVIIRRERLARLPKRKERLAEIGDGIEITDEELMEMESQEFEDYVVTRKQEWIEAQQAAKQAELDAKEAKLKEEAEKLENEKITREREEKARKEERERMEKEQAEKAERDRIAKEQEEAREKEAAERKEQEEKEEKERLEKEKKAEQKKLARRKKYQEFRASHGWTEENKATFKEENDGKTVVLWKKMGEFEI